jgi:hypothetical protein
MTDRRPAADSYAPPLDLGSLRRRALRVGFAASILTGIGAVVEPAQFFRSYLVAFVYWLSIAMGCFAIAMLHHLSRGGWGLMIRRLLEAASRTLPLLALFFVPLLAGLRVLYPWARPETVAGDPLLRHQAAYLNVPFFVLRTAFYFAVWGGFAFRLNRMSLRQDRDGDGGLSRRMQIAAAPGLVLYCLTSTFASIDWLMSLDPHWHSAIYGFYFVGGQAVSAMAFVIVVALYLSRRRPMSELLRPIHFQDYGKLLLTFVVLWTYFSVSQLIIVWQGNLPEEIGWYQGRLSGPWRWVSLLLVALHFALPLFLLLSRDLKKDVRRLAAVAMLLLVMRWVDLFWLAAPAFSPGRVAVHWLDLAAPVALGGLWVGVFAGELSRRPLLPAGDPFLAEALGHG